MRTAIPGSFRDLVWFALLGLCALMACVTIGRRTEGAISIGTLYVVNSTGDGDLVGSTDTCDDGTGHCTLRAAIQASNAHPGTDGIRFSIPSNDPGYSNGTWTINLPRELPVVTA
jgi:CSLREA domain-containing protein